MKSTLPFITCIFILSLFTTLHAQQCGFDIQREKLLQDPSYAELERASEERIKNLMLNGETANRNSSILTIPVVVHVLHLGESVGSGTNISDAQIQSSIDNLNDFYRGNTANSPIDFEIQFELAQRDHNCNVTNGINRIDASGIPNYASSGVSFNGGAGADEDTLKDLSRWPETDYFNIWIVSEINNNNGGSGYQGYANFFNGYVYEGSVMMYTVFGYDPTNANPSWPLHSARDNSTVVHEAGHFFHLYHTFQGDDTNGDGVSDTCPADTIVGTDSDGCADTVPHLRETSTCPAINSCTSLPWVDNNTINNIMSYYYCTDRLTNDQKTRVRAAMEGSSIVRSKGAIAPDGAFSAPVSVCSLNNATDLSGNYAGIVSVEMNGLNFKSLPAAADGGNLDRSINCSGYFEIDALTSNTLNIQVGPNFNQLGVWIDWNDDGDFDDEAEQQYPVTQGIAANSIVSVNLTYPTTIPFNDFVRLRIINDLDSGYANTVAIDSACFQNLYYGQSEDYTIYVEAGAVTYTYNNGWLPSNPVGVSTSNDTIIIEAGSTNIFADTECNTLTVDPGAALTIDSGVTVTTATVNLNSTSQMFSSLISNGTITGTVNYNRYTSQVGATGTNDLVSAPLSGQLFAAFASLNPNLAESGTVRAFAPYNTSVGMYQNYDIITNASTALDSGIGYRAGTTDGSTLTHTGTVLTSDVLDVAISSASAGYAWNLIGNPYPSYLDFNTFFQQNKSEFETGAAFQAIYGYDGSASNGWTVWNQATIDEGSITELIAPGQAFFVKAKLGGGLVDFTTAMRASGDSDDFIAGRQTITNAVLCKLNLDSETNSASTQIYFIDGTTRGLDDGYDAGAYFSDAGEFSIFSNLVEDNTGLDMAIQTVPYNDLSDIVIPIGVNTGAGNQLRFSIDDISSLPSNVNVYLEDNLSNTFTLLNINDYIITPSVNLNGTGRFYVHFTSQTLSSPQNSLNELVIYSSSNPKEIVIKGRLNADADSNLYDIRGRIVLRKPLDALVTKNFISVTDLTPGVYILSVSNDNQTITRKLIIN
ncbi:GEVED domain-containing protein [Winogradskyella pulchriflava]|uniref:GEVED domain-containing protein n=1 Tax=Winogradskyella pulchriflava TaxID=1110688 RepID=A0ABV6QEG1_9FLAO